MLSLVVFSGFNLHLNSAQILSCADHLCTANMREVLDLTWSYRARWKFIGIELGVDMGTLDAIEKNNRDVEDCLVRLLSVWLRGKATRSAMTRALQSGKVIGEATSSQGTGTTCMQLNMHRLLDAAGVLLNIYDASQI